MSVVTSRPRRDPTEPVAAYLGGFVFVGLAASLSGPALSFLRDRTGTDDGGIAVIFAGGAAGYVCGSLAVGRLLDSGKGPRVWAGAMLATVVALSVAVTTHSLAVMLAGFVVVGAGCGMADVCGNTMAVWSRPGRAGPLVNGLHLSFAVGALATPLIANRAISWTHSLWPALLPIAALAVVCGGTILRRPAPVRTRQPPPARPEGHASRRWPLVLVGAFLFAYVAVENGFAGWIHTYIEQIRYGGAGTATGVTAVFWTGFAGGRLAAIGLSRIVAPGWMVAGSTALSIVAAGAFAVVGPGLSLWVCTFVFAVSLAPQYASMVVFAETHLAMSGKAVSFIIASSAFGGLVMPWALGQWFDAYGPRSLPRAMVVATVVTGAIGLALGKLLTAQRPPATSITAPVT